MMIARPPPHLESSIFRKVLNQETEDSSLVVLFLNSNIAYRRIREEWKGEVWAQTAVYWDEEHAGQDVLCVGSPFHVQGHEAGGGAFCPKHDI